MCYNEINLSNNITLRKIRFDTIGGALWSLEVKDNLHIDLLYVLDLNFDTKTYNDNLIYTCSWDNSWSNPTAKS